MFDFDGVTNSDWEINREAQSKARVCAHSWAAAMVTDNAAQEDNPAAAYSNKLHTLHSPYRALCIYTEQA